MRLIAFLAILCGVLITGCGGGGGGETTSATAAPTLKIAWPRRSLSFSAPASARSAVLKLPRGRSDGQDSLTVINRHASPEPYTDSIRSVDQALLGVYEASVEFFADPNGAGDLVAIGSARVRLGSSGELTNPDGSALGAVTPEGEIRTVQWSGGRTMIRESPIPIPAFVTGEYGMRIAVSPGSVFVDVVSGAGDFEITSAGKLVSHMVGTATVRLRVDDVVSEPEVITTVAILTIAQPNDIVAAQPNGNLLTGTRVEGKVREMESTTGALLRTFDMGFPPSCIAVSGDGTVAYVGAFGSPNYKVINLTTGAISASVGLNPPAWMDPAYPLDMVVDPNDSTAIVVTFQQVGGFHGGATFYQAGVKRPMSLGNLAGTSAVFVGADRVVLQDAQFSSGRTTLASLDRTAIGGLAVLEETNSLRTGRVQLVGAKVLSTSGQVFEPLTLAPLADLTNAGFYGVYDPSVNAALFITSVNDVRVQSVNLSTGQLRFDIFLPVRIASISPMMPTIPLTAIRPGAIVLRSSAEIMVVSGFP